MRILVDTSSVEFYGNDGREIITQLIYPDSASQNIELFSEEGIVTVKAGWGNRAIKNVKTGVRKYG